MTLLLETVVRFLESQYPLSLAEDWDNVGLLVGDPSMPVRRVMTCLTVTPESCREAIEEKADLIVTHHPFPFQSVRQITTATTTGTMLWQLIRAGTAVYSAHTAFDSAATGINQQIAEKLGLREIETLYPVKCDDVSQNATPCEMPQGTGRIGTLGEPVPLSHLVKHVAAMLGLDVLPYVGSPEKMIKRVAIGCGAAGEFLEQAKLKNADAFLVGEAKFHQYLEASACDVAMILPGHYASERFAVEQMAQVLAAQFCEHVELPLIWASRQESDPVRYFLC